MKLLLDIGNTRIKWCTDDNGHLSVGQAIAYKTTDFTQQLQYHWLKLTESPCTLAISSVSAKQIAQQLIAIAKQIWPEIKVLNAQSTAHAFSVTNAYQQAEKLGVDRWLGIIAMQHYYPGNNCIVDCGTAITIDCLDDKGQHLGGFISPGLQLMKQSLQQGTEDLSLNKKEYPVGWSNDTESAIYSGTLYAAVGLVEKVIKDLNICNKLILTGGDAELLAKNLSFESIIEADFVLKGLSLYCSEGRVR
ncbi:MAG: type III pantothenate kinase [Methylococcales bacterium]|nr:type III pantothenate kinase [Methylococcales bacterium]